MSRTLVDIDDELLASAQTVLGTATKKDTLNEALREVVSRAARQREFEFWSNGGSPDLGDPEIMRKAWE